MDTTDYDWGGRAGNTHPPRPRKPTSAMPGTFAKLAVMERRAKRGEQIFHPNDAQAQIDGEGFSAAICLRGNENGAWKKKKAAKKEKQRIHSLKARHQATRATTTA